MDKGSPICDWTTAFVTRIQRNARHCLHILKTWKLHSHYIIIFWAIIGKLKWSLHPNTMPITDISKSTLHNHMQCYVWFIVYCVSRNSTQLFFHLVRYQVNIRAFLVNTKQPQHQTWYLFSLFSVMTVYSGDNHVSKERLSRERHCEVSDIGSSHPEGHLEVANWGNYLVFIHVM